MTSLTDNTIDELIKRVKTIAAVSDFVYTAEYPPREMPNPIGKYVVTVGNTGVRASRRFIGNRAADDRRGVLYEVTVRMRVYAPEESSGAALLRASSLLADAVDQADTDRMVQDIALSGIVYDTTARTVYRDLTLTLGMVLSGEVQDD